MACLIHLKTFIKSLHYILMKLVRLYFDRLLCGVLGKKGTQLLLGLLMINFSIAFEHFDNFVTFQVQDSIK